MNPLNPCFTDNYKRLGPAGRQGSTFSFLLEKQRFKRFIGVQIFLVEIAI